MVSSFACRHFLLLWGSSLRFRCSSPQTSYPSSTVCWEVVQSCLCTHLVTLLCDQFWCQILLVLCSFSSLPDICLAFCQRYLWCEYCSACIVFNLHGGCACLNTHRSFLGMFFISLFHFFCFFTLHTCLALLLSFRISVISLLLCVKYPACLYPYFLLLVLNYFFFYERLFVDSPCSLGIQLCIPLA